MELETLDWIKLAGDVVQDPNRIQFDNLAKNAFTHIAFDVWTANDSKVESLWILEKDEKDGKEYLVARYDNEDKPLETKSNWSAVNDKESKNITLAYRNVPIKRFASADFGFTKDDAYIFQRMLIEKTSSDKSFIKKLIE